MALPLLHRPLPLPCSSNVLAAPPPLPPPRDINKPLGSLKFDDRPVMQAAGAGSRATASRPADSLRLPYCIILWKDSSLMVRARIPLSKEGGPTARRLAPRSVSAGFEVRTQDGWGPGARARPRGERGCGGSSRGNQWKDMSPVYENSHSNGLTAVNQKIAIPKL